MLRTPADPFVIHVFGSKVREYQALSSTVVEPFGRWIEGDCATWITDLEDSGTAHTC